MKKSIVIMICAALMVFCSACAVEDEHIDLSDPLSGSSIVSAVDLEAFFLYGETNTAVLAASFSMEDTMLDLVAERGDIIINGNGFTLSGTADCIIRLGEGCKLTLNDITLHSGAAAIGCLGAAEVGGKNAKVIGVADGILCADELTISENSSIVCEGSNGCGVEANGITLKAGASLSGNGVLGGINAGESGITLLDGAKLTALTDENYNALKCDGMFEMKGGSEFNVENRGRYHGAEINEFDIEGVVTINAKGGDEASGLFVVEQTSDMYAIGSCAPAARFENGKGKLIFVDDASEIPDELPELTQAEAAAAAHASAAETEE